MSEMIQGLSFDSYKRGSKLIFYIWDGFGYGFRVGTYIPATRPIPVFWIRGKPKPIPEPSQSGENSSNWAWFGRIPAGMGFVSMPNSHNQVVI